MASPAPRATLSPGLCRQGWINATRAAGFGQPPRPPWAKAGSGGLGAGARPWGLKPEAPSQLPCLGFLLIATGLGPRPDSLPRQRRGRGIFQSNSEPNALLGKVGPQRKRDFSTRAEGRGRRRCQLYLFSLFCFRDLCRSPMSTTAARIPAFRQCILPAGWDMARRPPVPGRALARPPRAPVGPAPRAPRRPLPAPGRPPRMDPAPPRCAPVSGDRALTSPRPSASPRGPRGGRCPLPGCGHCQGSLGARPGRAAPGLPLRPAARARTPP